MPLTKEQKEERRKARLAEKAEDDKTFPGAFYAPRNNIQLILDRGQRWGGIRIRTNRLDQFTPSDIGGPDWVEVSVPLEDIDSLAELVAGLVARLNYLVREANEALRTIPPTEVINAPE